MGALPFIVRSHDRADVLVIPDSAKPEMSALTPLHWWTGNEDGRAIGMPGGGRQNRADGRPETLYQALIRELQEELEKNLRSLPAKYTARHLPHPFIVGQAPIVEDGDEAILNQIAVTSVYFNYDKFSRSSRYEIDTAVAEEKAYWMQLEWLFRIAQRSHPEQNRYEGLPFRPQILTSAILWHLAFTGHETRDQLVERTRVGNQAIISRLEQEANRMGRTIKNGTMNHTGRISERVSLEDRRFLLGRTAKKK
jgi:hypothetical protein